MLDTEPESITQKRSRAGKLGAAKVNAARTAARRMEVAMRAARIRWRLCQHCGAQAPGWFVGGEWSCSSGNCYNDRRFEAAIHFAGLDGPGDAPPETTP